MSNIRQFIFPLLLIGAALAGGWLLQSISTSESPDILWDGRLQQPCPLVSGECTAKTPYGNIILKITPSAIPLMQPLELQLLADAPALDRADISIRGLNMDMGILAFKLPDAIKGGFAGEGILPVCSQERMEWEALARLHTQDGFILVPFTFSTRQ